MFACYPWEACSFQREIEEKWISGRRGDGRVRLEGEEGGGNSGQDIIHERIINKYKLKENSVNGTTI